MPWDLYCEAHFTFSLSPDAFDFLYAGATHLFHTEILKKISLSRTILQHFRKRVNEQTAPSIRAEEPL